MELHLVVR
jgi:hypothetical protein